MTLNTFEGRFKYYKQLHWLYLRNTAYNVWSKLQKLDIICEQLFLTDIFDHKDWCGAEYDGAHVDK